LVTASEEKQKRTRTKVRSFVLVLFCFSSEAVTNYYYPTYDDVFSGAGYCYFCTGLTYTDNCLYIADETEISDLSKVLAQVSSTSYFYSVDFSDDIVSWWCIYEDFTGFIDTAFIGGALVGGDKNTTLGVPNMGRTFSNDLNSIIVNNEYWECTDMNPTTPTR